MKLLIVSDSHGSWRAMETVVKAERPDAVLHLGDVMGDAQKLSLACPDTPVVGVPGNCDGFFHSADTDRILSYDGVRLLLTHGHAYRVKSGTSFLARAAYEKGVDAALFGHTHDAVIERQPSGLWLVNPGSVGGVHAPATYALAWTGGGEVCFELKEV